MQTKNENFDHLYVDIVEAWIPIHVTLRENASEKFESSHLICSDMHLSHQTYQE